MRELACNEVNHVSGGNYGALVLSAICVGLIGSYLFSSSHVRYEPYTEIHKVVTPVYDANGTYLGDRVDNYEDIKYKPIYY